MASPSLHLQGLLDMGEFGTIYLCATGDELSAVKCFSRARAGEDEQRARHVQREKHILKLVSRLPHPFILHFRFVRFDNEHMFLGMEYIHGCSVFTLLQSRGSLSPDWARVYAAEVCLALGHIHSFDVIFRDLKPENVLIGSDGHTKLIDFGSALKMLGRRGANEPPPARIVSLGGTPDHMSPEILVGDPTCEESDWWSLGCFVSEMLTGSSPFVEANQNHQDIQDRILELVTRILYQPIRAPEHSHVGAIEASFIEALLVRGPSERLGARPHGHRAVLSHEWFDRLAASNLLLLKRHPAPWLPHLDGPFPEAEGGQEADAEAQAADAQRTISEATSHAQGAELVDETGATDEAQHELAAPLPLPPALLAGWGEWADVDVSIELPISPPDSPSGSPS